MSDWLRHELAAARVQLQKDVQAFAYIEATLNSVPVPSGQPDVSRAFTDIRQVMAFSAADRERAIAAAARAESSRDPSTTQE